MATSLSPKKSKINFYLLLLSSLLLYIFADPQLKNQVFDYFFFPTDSIYSGLTRDTSRSASKKLATEKTDCNRQTEWVMNFCTLNMKAYMLLEYSTSRPLMGYSKLGTRKFLLVNIFSPQLFS